MSNQNPCLYRVDNEEGKGIYVLANTAVEALDTHIKIFGHGSLDVSIKKICYAEYICNLDFYYDSKF